MKPQKTNDTAPNQVVADPWSTLLQFGAQLATALTATEQGGSTSHPWIEHDAATGNRSIKLPLPPPETTQRIADALSVMVDALRTR